MKLARSLFEEGAQLTAYDPSVRNGENPLLPDGVHVATDVLTATTETEAAVVMTEWSEIAKVDWAAVNRNMAPPRFVFDGRNTLDPVAMRTEGFEYVDVGRGAEPKDSGCGWRKVTRTGNTECRC